MDVLSERMQRVGIRHGKYGADERIKAERWNKEKDAGDDKTQDHTPVL